ncbi:hypothetical protein [Shinella pollutisoli]|uniref:Alkaline proteinase inhibitor/ Outer membrane lipoprotein Omp19 domain-containing protein n=1 Tax=Shinella pollutisoli TaxID=2250594 RepID=A0ABV7DHQ8_9HYPH|nr:hypothetical protein [Shinella pollutisoli]
MKTLIVAALAGVVSVGAWSLTGHEEAGVDPVVSHSVPVHAGARSYTISNVSAGAACLAERGGKISNRSERFTAEADCEAVWPGLSRAHTWINNGDGTIDLADAQGEAIITVVDGDGLAYEAVEPSEAMVTLMVAD